MPADPAETIPPVVKTVTVDCTPDEAFRYFTADFGKWWPLATHSCIAFSSGHTQKPAACTFEQRQGGRIFETGASGEEHTWGTVLSWEPPTRVVFTWHPLGEERTAQTVEVRFTASPGGTEVVLTHSDWERLGALARQARDGYDQGWESVFGSSYAEYARGRAAA